MFGIHGLDPFGLVHTTFGFASLLLGLAVVLTPKGTSVHRRIGHYYTVNMLMLNVTALAIYDLTGRFNGFHVLALISLATIAAGVVPAWTRRPEHGWLERHGRFMAWSFAGVIAAFVAEVTSRLPQLGVAFTVGGMFVVMTAAAILIETRVPRLIR
jgi:uncharacterized membrane protein